MITQAQQLTVGTLTTLIGIDFSKCIGFTPTGTTLIRLTANKNGTGSIVYDGNTYQYVGFEANGFRSEMNGKAPNPTVIFDKASLFANADYMNLWNQYTAQTGEDYFDWRGAKFYIGRTVNLSTAQQTSIQEYTVNQVNKITTTSLEIGLSVSLGVDRLGGQAVQSLAINMCSRKYRTWNGTDFTYLPEDSGGCPYGNPTTVHNWSAVPSFGVKYFDIADNALLDANKSQDKCSRSAKGCQQRFDPAKNGLTLPFKGLYKPTNLGV